MQEVLLVPFIELRRGGLMMKNKEHPVCVNFMFSLICLNNIYRNIRYCLFNRYHLCFELIARHTGKYNQPVFQAWKLLASMLGKWCLLQYWVPALVTSDFKLGSPYSWCSTELLLLSL